MTRDVTFGFGDRVGVAQWPGEPRRPPVGRKQREGTDPAWQRYFDAIDAARKAENEVWARAPGVASRVRLWLGFYTPSQRYPDGELSVFIYVRPQVGQRVLEPILVEFKIPRHGDLPDDIAAAEAKGWMPVGHDPAAEPNWRIDDHALRFDRKPPPPL